MKKNNEHVTAPKIYYECDPSKNTTCNKRSCYLHGGPCEHTTNIAFARKPIANVKLVLPMSEEDMNGIKFQEEK